MDSIYLYATPAFMALTIKLWLVIRSDKRNLIIKNWPLTLFFLAISIFNIIEVLTYSLKLETSYYDIFIKLYNGAVMLAICFLMIFSARLAKIKLFINGNFSYHYAAFCTLFFLIMISTNLFISGYEKVGYGFTRIPGKYFEIPHLFTLMNLTFSFIFLILGTYKNNVSQLNRRRCKTIITSFLPFMATLFLIIMLMELKLTVTGAVIIPLTTTYLLIVLVLTESETGLFNLLSKTPFTKEYKILHQVNRDLKSFIIDTSAGKSVSLKELSSSIEKKLVCHAIDCSQGNQSIAAKTLGISPSSLCRKK